MNYLPVFSLFIVLSLFRLDAFAQTPVADYVFTNGSIYTVDADNPKVEALAIHRDSIVFAGSSDGVLPYIGSSTKVADLKGKMIMPGLVETHLHVMLGAVATSGVWLAEEQTLADVQKAISDFATANPDKDVIFGWGYLSTLFGPDGPSKDLLDAAVADRPVFVVREDGHSAWANSKALAMAGVTADTPDPAPPAGVFGRDASGNPTGAINGGPANVWMLNRLPGAVSEESLVASASPLLEEISELGITSVFDAGAMVATDAAFSYLVQLDNDGNLPFRYHASHYINSATQADAAISELKRLSSSYKSKNFQVTTLKITTDGVVENRKAALLSPYNDVAASGALNFEPEVIKELSVEAAKNGFGVYMHTLGDRAVRVGLDAAEAVRASGFEDTVITLSHCQLIDPADFYRFAQIDVFINSTGGWMQPYAGEETVLGSRSQTEYPFRTMIDEGVVFVNSSDFPATPIIDPFTHLEVSITRRPPGAPMDAPSKNPNSALSLAEAIEAYTINGARMLEMDSQVGSLKVGKRADIIILDQVLDDIPANEIHKTQVLLTMTDGVIWHDALYGWGDSVDAPAVNFSTGFDGLHRH